MPLRPRRSSIRPFDEPASTNPTGMDFEKRQLIVTSVSGSTVRSMLTGISSAILTYEGEIATYNGEVLYKL